MATFEKAVLIYNGNAGDSDTAEKLSLTVPILSQSIAQLTLIQTKTIEEMKSACSDAASKVDLLIVLGGDGTLHTAVNSIAPLAKRPVLAVLPGGTANDFSRALQIPQDLEEAARALVSGKVQSIDVGQAENTYFLNFWGIGLVAETSKNVAANQKERFGAVSYFISTLKTIREAKAFSYELEADETLRTGEAVLLLVLNGRFIGTHELPIDKLSPSDGMLDVLIVKNSSLAALRELLALQKNDTDKQALRELEHFRTTGLTIKTATSEDVDTDGEIYTQTPANITILPNHLQMLIPAE